MNGPVARRPLADTHTIWHDGGPPRGQWAVARARLSGLAALAAFVVAYGLDRLYTGNQNTYFLRGLARAGYGSLESDWLASTADPTPVFTFIVWLVERYLDDRLFYVLHAGLLAVYAASLYAIASVVVGGFRSRIEGALVFATLLAIHATAIRRLSVALLGRDLPWHLQAGVADQYIAGPYLQPSAFGVLMPLAVALLMRGRIWPAALALGVAGTVHPTYVLPVLLLAAGGVAMLLQSGRASPALAGAWAGAVGVFLLPISLYAYGVYRHDVASVGAEARAFLVHERLPHHARPAEWLAPDALAQMVLIVAALTLVLRGRRRWMLSVPAAGGAALSVLQVTTSSDALALVFPWRISAVLVPVAATVLLAALLTGIVRSRMGHHVRGAAIALALGVASFAVAWGALSLGSPDRSPDVSATSGAAAFAARERASIGLLMVPPNLAFRAFRLESGVPIVADWKSHPYAPAEIIEWRQRLEAATRFYHALSAGECEVVAQVIRDLYVTHVVGPSGPLTAACGELMTALYEDDQYALHVVPRASVLDHPGVDSLTMANDVGYRSSTGTGEPWRGSVVQSRRSGRSHHIIRKRGGRPGSSKGAHVKTYMIRRRKAWASPKLLERTAAKSRKIGDEEMPDRVRWIRSYVVQEEDGTLGTVCIYQAVDPEAITEHARRVEMPADEIVEIANTVVVRPDPEPA